MAKASVYFKINQPVINRVLRAQQTALEQTGEWLHTDVVQSQTMPWRTGHLQGESTYVDHSESKNGTVSVISSTPYARRLYFHPEYHFYKGENPEAGGEWYKPYFPGGEKADALLAAYRNFFRRQSGI